MPAFDAAIFDLDGLLIDTERLAIDAGHDTLKTMGWPQPDGLFHRLTGKDQTTGLGILAAHFGPAFPVHEFGGNWNQRFDDMLDDGIPLRPGAIALLDQLLQIGLPRAVATSSQRSSAERKLRITGLDRYFTTVVSVNCIANPKPAPDPYLEAARRLGADPTRCVAFEDSDTGAEAAHRAGMRVVQVPDMLATTGPYAHHLADDLLSGARMAGLI